MKERAWSFLLLFASLCWAGCSSESATADEMVPVPAGTFGMGCNAAVDNECERSENPYHQVTVPAFRIDKYAVRAGQYKACADGGGCTATSTLGKCNYNDSGKRSDPINCVDWNQAKAYCAWLGKRLPTEAEWEKAARGTDGRKYPWGNIGLDCDHAVDSVSPCSSLGTAAVGSKPLGGSPYGAMDMVGNVWEWVQDWYHDNYNGAPANGSAWENPIGTDRVLRGGAWASNNAYLLRASYRGGDTPSISSTTYGFRCVLDVAP